MAIHLYMVKTVLKYSIASWKNSRIIKEKYKSSDIRSHRLFSCMDLIYWFVRYGNDFNNYCTFEFWNKSSNERKTYISRRRNDALGFLMSTPRVYNLLLDKSAFNRRYSKYVKRSYITTLDHSWSDLTDFLSVNSKTIAKPLDSSCGRGVFLLDKSKSDYQSKVDNLRNLFDEKCSYILEEAICNCDEIRRIAPSSLNTVRIVTVIDKNKELHIIAAMLRVGDGVSVIDNYCSGGMVCAIDFPSGRLKGMARNQKCETYEAHPYSNIKFDGYEVPYFRECIDLIKEIAFVEPEAKYVGWDLAITPNGIDLLEGNIPPDEEITQIATGCGMWYQLLSWM